MVCTWPLTWSAQGLRAARRHRRRRLLFQDRPIKHVVILVVEGAEEDAEELAEVHVVGSLLEAQASAVVEVHCKLRRITLCTHTMYYSNST